MVEARGLAGVPYPSLDYQPSVRFASIIAEGRASIEQAEQAISAIKANTGPKSHGYLAADNVGVVRPAFIRPGPGIRSRTRFYQAGIVLLKPVFPLFPFFVRAFPSVFSTGLDVVTEA